LHINYSGPAQLFEKRLFDKTQRKGLFSCADNNFNLMCWLLAQLPVTAGVDGSVSLTTLQGGVETFQAIKKSRLHFLMLFSVCLIEPNEGKQGHHFLMLLSVNLIEPNECKQGHKKERLHGPLAFF